MTIHPIYRLLGMPPYYLTPPQVDDIELWLIAEMIGVNPDKGWLATLVPQEGPAEDAGPLTADEFRNMAAAQNAERMRRMSEGLPPLDDSAARIGSVAPVLPPGTLSQLPIRRSGRIQPGR